MYFRKRKKTHNFFVHFLRVCFFFACSFSGLYSNSHSFKQRSFVIRYILKRPVWPYKESSMNQHIKYSMGSCCCLLFRLLHMQCTQYKKHSVQSTQHNKTVECVLVPLTISWVFIRFSFNFFFSRRMLYEILRIF